MFESAIGEIKKYNRIIIHRHTNPDGDAIGSQVGMKELLKKNFPEKFFRLGTLLKKGPHPLKKKVFLINLEDSFLDI